MLRDFSCGELGVEHLGQEVKLCGWIQKTRNLGQLLFIDLRDKYGITQLNFDQYPDKELIVMGDLSLETVISISGKVGPRPTEAQNSRMKTGMIEVMVEKFEILSKATTPPFLPCGPAGQSATEELRLRYRYLDLRSPKLQDVLKIRSDVMMKVREFFYQNKFIEVETPILYKSTPEGARDFLVPSRLQPGHVYALPQSPQILKQLLMIGGTDRYIQICRCFRDEAFRADRQPEFTQIDVEMSFVEESDIKSLATQLMIKIFNLANDFEIPNMSYDQALLDYGTDRPDVRFGLIHHDMTKLVQEWDFPQLNNCRLVKAIFLAASIGTPSRKDLESHKDVYWFKINGDSVSGGVSKFIPKEQLALWNKENVEGMWLIVGSDNITLAHQQADVLRRDLAEKFHLIDKNSYKFLWVHGFPLFDWDEETKSLSATHHPFTRPSFEDEDIFYGNDIEKIKKIKAIAYDLVCNGSELGGGSLRIFNPTMQEKMFEHLGMSPETREAQFGHFIQALKFGTPPHGGLALGLDRIIMILTKTEQIREVIAFPKSTSGVDLMSSAPSKPSIDQTNELHFSFNKK